MRLFEALDKLNLMDAENNTSNVGICPDMISCDKHGDSGNVKIGVPGDVALKICTDPERYKPILLIVDMDEYKKING